MCGTARRHEVRRFQPGVRAQEVSGALVLLLPDFLGKNHGHDVSG